jgi:hypothetical protein
MRLSYFGGAITAFPIVETINSDISEYIATNIISITDGQLYTSKRLFLTTARPAIDSALSVSRIGSNAQCKLMKCNSSGVKNTLTTLRVNAGLSTQMDNQLATLNITFSQDFLLVSTLDFTIALLTLCRLGVHLKSAKCTHNLAYLLAYPFLPVSYLLFLVKSHCYTSSIMLIDCFMAYIAALVLSHNTTSIYLTTAHRYTVYMDDCFICITALIAALLFVSLYIISFKWFASIVTIGAVFNCWPV